MRASRLKKGGFTGNGEYASLEIASMEASIEAAANAWLQVYPPCSFGGLQAARIG
jgi:hypothetical protein